MLYRVLVSPRIFKQQLFSLGQEGTQQEKTLRAGQAGPAVQPCDLGELPSLAGYAGEGVAAVRLSMGRLSQSPIFTCKCKDNRHPSHP